MREWTPRLAKALKVVGLINIQYCVQDNKVRSALPVRHLNCARVFCPLPRAGLLVLKASVKSSLPSPCIALLWMHLDTNARAVAPAAILFQGSSFSMDDLTPDPCPAAQTSTLSC